MARTISASFSKALALIVAGTLASTSAMPLALAQGKGAPAVADAKKRDAARKAYQGAEKDYAAGKYAEAVAGFKKANEILPSPHAEYWIAMSLDKQGKGEDAAAAFEKLLGHADVSKLGDEKIEQVKKRVGELKGKQTGEVNIATTPPGASVSVDGTSQPGETPMIIKLPPGAHTITITNPGYEKQEIKVDVAAGQRLDKNVELKAADLGGAPAPAPAPEAPAPAEPEKAEPAPPPQPKSKVPAYVTLGIAGAATAVGAFFGVKALGAKSDFNDDPTTDNADTVERNALIADMAFGVAITLGVTGVVLLTSGDSEPAKEKAAKTKRLPQKARFNVAPYATPSGGGAAARFVF
ncbi:MAG: PEGA domain-containing protein [Myxococcales bacterium]|nr:PEGA domain-containing protein [Myxococcales bacterium]